MLEDTVGAIGLRKENSASRFMENTGNEMNDQDKVTNLTFIHECYMIPTGLLRV